MKTNKKKILVPLLVLALVVTTIGGTLAWLMDKTAPVENVFSVGNVDVELAESEGLDLQMIPGKTITKDPVVTFKAGSEKSYVFVKVDEENMPTYLTYDIDSKWTKLGESNVYWQLMDKADVDQELPVIKDDKVTVGDNIGNTEMDAAKANAPKLTFTAYAVQWAKDKTNFTPEEAWNIAQGLNPDGTK